MSRVCLSEMVKPMKRVHINNEHEFRNFNRQTKSTPQHNPRLPKFWRRGLSKRVHCNLQQAKSACSIVDKTLLDILPKAIEYNVRLQNSQF